MYFTACALSQNLLRSIMSETLKKSQLTLSAAALMIIALIMTFGVMKILSALFIQVFLAILFTLMLHPLVHACVHIGIPKWLTISFIIAVTFSLITLFIVLLIGNLRQFTLDLNALLPVFADGLEELAEKFNLSGETNIISARNLTSQISRWISSYIFKFANSSLTFISSTLFVALMTAFLLLEIQNYHYKFQTVFSSETSRRLAHIGAEVTSSMNRYLSIKTLISAVTGFTIYLCLTVAGANYASMWGILGFVFNFVPVIGSAIIMAATMAMALLQMRENPAAMWFVLITMPGLQLVYGQILEPRLQGNTLNISPFIVLIGVLFWGWMWGVPGVFLSVPMMVFIKVLVANFGPYKALSALMEIGAPPKDWTAVNKAK